MFTTRNIVLAGLMAALVTVGTMLIQVPMGASGYVHLGDSMVYFAGILFGPVLGGLAAGIGSFMADMLSGYAIYAVPTFIIKGLDAAVIAIVYKVISGKTESFARKMTAYVIAFTAGSILMASGYFLYETFMYGMESALPWIVPNLFQGIVGGAISVPFFLLLTKSKAFKVVGHV